MTADDGTVRSVRVNGLPAPAAPNYSRWEVVLDGIQAETSKLVAAALDEAGNREQIPHRASIGTP